MPYIIQNPPSEDEYYSGAGWSHNSNLMGNYPIPATCIDYTTAININEIYSIWTFDATVGGYPHPSTQCPAFNISESYTLWNVNQTELDGYLTPKNIISVAKMGAFMNTINLTSIQLSIYVTKIGRYAFYNSGLTGVTASPDCEFSSLTFPSNCTISYYNATFSVTLPDSTIEFYKGDDYESYLNQSQMTITVTDGTNSVTRNVKYTIDGVSTDTVGTNFTGYLVFTYTNSQTQYRYPFTYTVKSTIDIGYTRLNYIESTGTQYITTAVTMPMSVIMDIQFSNVGHEQYTGFLGNSGCYFGVDTSGGIRGDSGNVQTLQNVSGFDRNTIEAIFAVGTYNKVGIYGTSNYVDGLITASTSNPFIIFAIAAIGGGISSAYNCSAKLYSADFYDSSNNIILQLLPYSRDADGVVGMLDMLTGNFYTNSGSGTFIGG